VCDDCDGIVGVLGVQQQQHTPPTKLAMLPMVLCCCRQDTQEDYETFVLPLLQKYPEVRGEHFKPVAVVCDSRAACPARAHVAYASQHMRSVQCMGHWWPVADPI
jgi:hypothetical protein